MLKLYIITVLFIVLFNSKNFQRFPKIYDYCLNSIPSIFFIFSIFFLYTRKMIYYFFPLFSIILFNIKNLVHYIIFSSLYPNGFFLYIYIYSIKDNIILNILSTLNSFLRAYPL